MYYHKQSLKKHYSNTILNLVKIALTVLVLFFSNYLLANTTHARIESLQIEQSSGKLRISFDITKSVKYKVFTLKSPERVVIDFKNTSAAQRIFRFSPSPSSDPIKKIRHSIKDNKNLRVVFDMEKPVGVMSRLKKLKSGSRIELVLSNTSIGKSSKRYQISSTNTSIRNKKTGDFIVVIDPGHGGKDPGAIGLNGIKEKEVVLQIAKRLKAKIDAQRGMRAIMTRSGDTFIPLKERVYIASRSKADLFISVHANSNVRRSMSGASVYILSRRGASSEAAHFIAARENGYHSHTLDSIDFSNRNRMIRTVLLDLTRTSTIARSLKLAKSVLNELATVNNLQRGRVESAAFVVLKSLDIPSMLVETAYISNPKEEIQLTQADYQNKLATAMFKGIKRYYLQNSPKARHFASLGGKYIVRPGDTLLGIANRHRVTLSQLKRANNLKGNVIRIGQKLQIPSS